MRHTHVRAASSRLTGAPSAPSGVRRSPILGPGLVCSTRQATTARSRALVAAGQDALDQLCTLLIDIRQRPARPARSCSGRQRHRRDYRYHEQAGLAPAGHAYERPRVPVGDRAYAAPQLPACLRRIHSRRVHPEKRPGGQTRRAFETQTMRRARETGAAQPGGWIRTSLPDARRPDGRNRRRGRS